MIAAQTPRLEIVLGSMILALASTACVRGESEPWPELSVGHLEEDAQEQLTESRANADTTGSDPSADAEARAVALSEHALDLHCYEQFENAAFFYDRVRAHAPEDPRWPHLQGLALARSGRSDQAVHAFSDAAELNPSAIATWLHLGSTELELGREAVAREAFEQALAIDSQSASALWGLGRLDLDAGRTAAAIERFERALEIDPGAGAVHYSLGLAYRDAGDDANAARHLALRGDRFPTIPDPFFAEVRTRARGLLARLNRGMQLSQQGRFEEAIEQYEAVLARDPEHPIAHLYSGLTASRLGDRERAFSLLARAETLAPADERPSLFQGILLAANRRDDEAVLAFERAIERAPDVASARVERARALQRLGRLDEALAGYEAALGIDPEADEAHWGRITVYVALGRYPEARTSLERQLVRAPGQPAFRHALARLLAASPQRVTRDGATALRLAEELRQGGMQSVDLLETAAMALAETGRFTDAVRVQMSAIGVLDRGNAPAWARSVARRRMERYRNEQATREPWASDDPIFAPAPSPLTSYMN